MRKQVNGSQDAGGRLCSGRKGARAVEDGVRSRVVSGRRRGVDDVRLEQPQPLNRRLERGQARVERVQGRHRLADFWR